MSARRQAGSRVECLFFLPEARPNWEAELRRSSTKTWTSKANEKLCADSEEQLQVCPSVQNGTLPQRPGPEEVAKLPRSPEVIVQH
ncbi:hypothetical protein NDU88_002835 [Pleurodeles waltl]|uniref:Uncharacterized protein n=1 Tax=Pleurodeles waltl TaxID=8319 RepID=A0AAV7UZP6_PLEWA|nr:hypothetical protein NDU88_002835 [Pleurodeles waltl]